MKNTKKRLLYGISIVLIYTIYWISKNSILFYVATALLLISILFPNTDILLLYSFWLPNVMLIKYIGNSSAILGFFSILLAVKMAIQEKMRLRLPIKLVVAVFLHLISISITVALTGNMPLYLSIIRFVAFIYITSQISRNWERDGGFVFEVINAFTFGVIINTVFGFAYYIAVGKNIFSGFFAGINNDRNYYSILTAVAMGLLLCEIYVYQKVNLWQITALAISAGGGILSGSRTFFILLLVLGIAAIFTIIHVKKNGFFYLIAPLIILLLFLAFELFFLDSIHSVILRFSNDDAAGGNGRIDLWQFYLKEIFSSIQNMLFGVGNTIDAIRSGRVRNVEHNTFVQALFNIGIAGFATLLYVFFQLKATLYKNQNRTHLITYVPILLIIIGYSTISSLYSDAFSFVLFLGIVTPIAYVDSQERL